MKTQLDARPAFDVPLAPQTNTITQARTTKAFITLQYSRYNDP